MLSERHKTLRHLSSHSKKTQLSLAFSLTFSHAFSHAFSLLFSPQSSPAVQQLSSPSDPSPHLHPLPTRAHVPAQPLTLTFLRHCRGTPCRLGARRWTAIPLSRPTETEASSTTAGPSTATSPWRPGKPWHLHSHLPSNGVSAVWQTP